MTGRLPSGDAGLDGILRGGLPDNAITLMVGPPGSGKTILAEQYVFTNATPERPALYLSTITEPRDKLIRYAQTLSFFTPDAIGSSVFYEDLGRPLGESGLPGALDTIAGLVREHRPGLIVIDSFKALEAFAQDSNFRRFLHDVAGHLTAFRASSLWIGEYTPDSLTTAPVFAVADAILSLSTEHDGPRQMRLLEVLKLRGSDFASGRHAYRLSSGGIRVFPRLADIGGAPYTPDARRISSGIPAVDEMLEDGYWADSTTLVVGPSGSGKTLMGLEFVFAGAAAGDAGIIATLQENPTQLARAIGPFGWSLDQPGVELLYRSPIDLYLEEWLADVLDLVTRTGARRLMIDSIRELRVGTTDPVRFREYLYSLLQHCSRAGVSLMMTLEAPAGASPSSVIEYGVSNLSDNVVILDFAPRGGEMRRTIAITKTRGSGHDARVRDFSIGPEGIVLAAPVAVPGV